MTRGCSSSSSATHAASPAGWPSPTPRRQCDWLALRGQTDAFAPLRATFAAALARDGRDAVLRAALPALLPGVAAAAFHGVIRTAHAVEAAHDGELAAALAYWAWRWQPLAPAPRGAALPVDAVVRAARRGRLDAARSTAR